jgi:hypothetical protein
VKRPLFRPPSATGDIDDLAVFLDARYIAKGYLMKLSTKKKWQRRMYQLKGPWLMYWETDHATRKDMTITRSQYTVTMPDAAIDLRRISSCRVESAADSNTGVLLLTSASGRVIQMKATSDSCEEQGVLSRWETAILAQMDRYKAAARAAESGDGAQTAEVVLKDGHEDAGSEEDAAAASAAGAAAGETATERQSEFVALQQSPILVLGGTGSVGKATLRSLARARAGDATSSPILAAVRTPDPSLPKNVEIAAPSPTPTSSPSPQTWRTKKSGQHSWLRVASRARGPARCLRCRPGCEKPRPARSSRCSRSSWENSHRRSPARRPTL